MKSTNKIVKALLGGGAILLLVSVLCLSFVSSALAFVLEPGDIIVADHAGLIFDNQIIKVNPADGTQQIISSGGLIKNPEDVRIGSDGFLYVNSHWVLSDGSDLSIVKIDPSTGAQTEISTQRYWSGGRGADWGGMVIDNATGNIFVSEIYGFNGIVKVNPSTGVQTILHSGSPFSDPWDLDIDLDDNLVVADGHTGIIKINPVTGATSPISSGSPLVEPHGIVVVKEARPPNQPPVADAGDDQTVILGETVEFDGSGSSDDGTIVSYAWDFGDRHIRLGETPTHDYSLLGTYIVILKVTDDGGETGTDSLAVTVQTLEDAVQDLIAGVIGLNLPKGTENSLVSKLDNAIKSLDKGQDEAAINQLNAFINAVEAQRGKKITDEEAVSLIATAEGIITNI